jgi:cation diffusion facilitator family transporter
VTARLASDAPRSKRNAALLSVALTGTSVIIKGGVAFVTGSSAVLAETAHSFSDLLAALIALAAVRAADRPPDPKHPFGHQKLEHVSAVIEGLILIVVAGFVVLQSARSFGEPVENSSWHAASRASRRTPTPPPSKPIRRTSRPTSGRASAPRPRSSSSP